MSQTITSPRRRQFRLKPGTILNLVVFGVVAIALLIYFRPPRPIVPSIDMSVGMTNEPVPVATVLDTRVNDMTRVHFARQDEVFTLELDGEYWTISSPFTDRADDTLVASLVENLAGIAFDEEITDPEPDEAYGFHEPLIRAEFTLTDGTQQTLIIGQPEGSIEYFVKTSASDSVYLVRNLPERLFTIIGGEMIYGPLLDFNPADVQKIVAVAADGSVKEIDREGNSWFTDTEYGRALVFDVDVFLRDLHAISGSSIAATAESNRWVDLGIEPTPETMYIELTLTDGSTHMLEVGRSDAAGRRYYVRSSDRPHAYVVVEFSAVNLSRKLAAASTDILRVNTARVTNVEVRTVTADGTPVVRRFARDNNNHQQWTSERRVAFYVPALIESLNGVVTFQRAPEASDEAYGFVGSPHALSATLEMENKAKYVLEIGNVTSDGRYVYVRSSTREGVYLASIDTVQEIRDSLSIIRTDLLPFDATKVASVEITTVDGDGNATVRTVTRSDDAWLLDGTAVDGAKVDAMVNQLRGLQAEKLAPVLDAEEDYEFYPAPNSLRVAVRTTDGDELILDVGGSVTEGTGWFSTVSHYVRVNDLEDVVFIGDRNNTSLRNAINGVIN